MSIEKNKEELKERMLNARALSDEELEQVAGGFGGTCPYGVSCDSPSNWAYCQSVGCSYFEHFVGTGNMCGYFGSYY